MNLELKITRVIPGHSELLPKGMYALLSSRQVVPTIVKARSWMEAQSVEEILNMTINHGPWKQLAEALRIEFIWPNWIKYQDDLRKEGITLRGTANPLRNKIGIYNEQGNVRNSAYVEHLFMYSKSKLLPEPEESEGFRLDRRVRMFEGALPSLGSILLLAKLLPANILNAYLANTWESNQLDQFPNSEISAQYLFELNNCRLVVKPSEVSIDRLAYATRRPVICPDTYAYRAPDPWNWQEFQDFRCLYTEMLAMLVDWLSGWDGGSGARMYLSRRG